MFSLNIYEWQQDVARYVVLRIPPLVHLCQICIYLKGYQTTQPADNSDRDKSARKRGLVGPYVKTTRTINKIDRYHKDTVWHLSTVLGNVKKNPYIINQNHIFFNKLLWSHFWIDFYKCYTKTFGIVYILIGYLLIMLLWVIFICT